MPIFTVAMHRKIETQFKIVNGINFGRATLNNVKSNVVFAVDYSIFKLPSVFVFLKESSPKLSSMISLIMN